MMSFSQLSLDDFRDVKQALVIYNSLNISYQANPGLGRLLLKHISKIERIDNMRFPDKNLVQRSSKKIGSLREKRDKALATPLV